MRLEQAIFTSVRSERLDGYQLAARSEGVSDDLAMSSCGTSLAAERPLLHHVAVAGLPPRQLQPAEHHVLGYDVAQEVSGRRERHGVGGGVDGEVRAYVVAERTAVRRVGGERRDEPASERAELVGGLGDEVDDPVWELVEARQPKG